MNYFSNRKKWMAYLILLTFVFTCIMPTNLGTGNAVYAEEISDIPVSSMINKTATPLDEDDCTDVTLSVPSNQEQLGVDIIYIAGAHLASDQVEEDLMIESLYATFAELVGGGVPVNFGFVPFSYNNKAVMELTSYHTLADLENLHNDLKAAIDAAGDAYGGENMENALQVAKNMFAASPLAAHPERQHLVLVSSGHTYNFNVGDDNEIFSTVPVAINGSEKAGKYFYGFRAWQQARNYNPNTYPIPKVFSTYNDYRDWDAYWAKIEKWAAADVAAGDKVVYMISDTTDSAFTYNDWYDVPYLGQDSKHDDVNTFKTYGLYIHTATRIALENGFDFANAVKVTRDSLGKTDLDKVADSAKHAISYERAMWEANNFINNQITGAGINFYPIYNQLKPEATNGADCKSNGYGVDWTNQYIGHSFMDMLARNVSMEKAINNSNATDKAFFDPIKEKILCYCSKGSTVEDYIGYDAEKGNFEFIQNADYITLTKGGVAYTTTPIATKEGADSSYAFTAPGATEPTFWLDYYYGNGTTTEKIIWTFGENVFKYIPVSLTYKLQLTEKAKVREGELVSIYDNIPTNNSATLYPVDSDGNEGTPELFPVPYVFYVVQDETVRDAGMFVVDKVVTGNKAPAENNEYGFRLYVDARIEKWDASLVSRKLELEDELDAARAKAENAAGVVADMEVTTPAAIQVVLTPTEENSSRETLVYDLTPESYDVEDGYVIDFTLFKDTGYAVTVEATTGTMIKYAVNEISGFDSEDYLGTDVMISINVVSSDESVRYSGELELAPDVINNIRFQNNYTNKTEGNTPSSDGDDYTPPGNNDDDDYTPPKGNTDETIDDPKVPLGDAETPAETIDNPDIPLGDMDMPDEELDEPEIPLGDAPATGDNANAIPFMALLLVAIAGLVITRRKFN